MILNTEVVQRMKEKEMHLYNSIVKQKKWPTPLSSSIRDFRFFKLVKIRLTIFGL